MKSLHSDIFFRFSPRKIHGNDCRIASNPIGSSGFELVNPLDFLNEFVEIEFNPIFR